MQSFGWPFVYSELNIKKNVFIAMELLWDPPLDGTVSSWQTPTAAVQGEGLQCKDQPCLDFAFT